MCKRICSSREIKCCDSVGCGHRLGEFFPRNKGFWGCWVIGTKCGDHLVMSRQLCCFHPRRDKNLKRGFKVPASNLASTPSVVHFPLFSTSTLSAQPYRRGKDTELSQRREAAELTSPLSFHTSIFPPLYECTDEVLSGDADLLVLVGASALISFTRRDPTP